MQKFRVWWNSFKTVALLISFSLNMLALIVLLLLLMQIFQVKNGVVEPWVDGLYRNIVGLDEAVIASTIQIDQALPVAFDLPIQQTTRAVLTQDVPIAANATFTLPGGGGVINGRVDIVLPRDLVLPLQLDMSVPVDTSVPLAVSVDVEIPLKETQVHAPLQNLRDLLEPYVRVIDNLPHAWNQVPDFVADALRGEGADLLAPTHDSQHPWPGPGTGPAGS